MRTFACIAAYVLNAVRPLRGICRSFFTTLLKQAKYESEQASTNCRQDWREQFRSAFCKRERHGFGKCESSFYQGHFQDGNSCDAKEHFSFKHSGTSHLVRSAYQRE